MYFEMFALALETQRARTREVYDPRVGWGSVGLVGSGGIVPIDVSWLF